MKALAGHLFYSRISKTLNNEKGIELSFFPQKYKTNIYLPTS